MKVLRGDPHAWIPASGGTVLTVGVFDGVHVGHRLIGRLVLEETEKRSGLAAGIVTFDRHPLATITPGSAPVLLTTIDEQVDLWEELGMAFVAVLTFDDAVRSMSPAQFAGVVLSGGLGARHVVVGRGFRFGRDGIGDVTELERLGQELEFSVQSADLVEEGDAPVSSTLIRSAIAEGDVGSAAAWLGRPFARAGTVVPGASRGADIGFPTANLAITPGLALPGRGVYAAFATVGDQRWPAVVNVGTRPTFDGTEEVVEAHLLDFTGDVYGQTLVLEFVQRLRAERRFQTVDDLVEQIGSDVVEARALLAGD